MDNSWTICQLGAREHYAIPRALNKAGATTHLITEAWQPLNYGIPRFSGRYHTDLTGTRTTAFNLSSILFEFRHRSKNTDAWHRIIERNDWFQKKASSSIGSPENLFSYSYTARLPFQKAKKLENTKTILGQIDPGPVEWDIIQAESERFPEYPSLFDAPPASYWDAWKEEIALSDHIVANSAWAAKNLPQEKVSIIPLAYSPPKESVGFARSYPQEFTNARPLRVLFLGQANLRKGIVRVIQAADLLKDAPIEFHIVGDPEIPAPSRTNITWHGSCPRSKVDDHYRRADIFLFPTLSDGFGMTQLEAMAWKLPSITTPYCAPVVADMVNGRILEPEPHALAELLEALVKQPEQLATWSEKCALSDEFSLESIGKKLIAL